MPLRGRWRALQLLALWAAQLALAHALNAEGNAGNSELSVDADDFRDPMTGKPITDHEFDEQQTVANNVTIAGLTLYVWEYLSLLPRELGMYRRKMLMRPQVLLFLLIRYGTVPAIVLPAYSFYGIFTAESDCLQHEQVTVAVVQFLVSCIFSWRTTAIWRRNQKITLLLVVLTFAVFATNIGLLFYSDDVLVRGGACRPGLDQNNINTVPWFYLTSMVFDTVTMVLSSYKLIAYANMGQRFDSDHPVFRDPFNPTQRETVAAEHGASVSLDSSRRKSSLAQPVSDAYRFVTTPIRMMHRWNRASRRFTPLLARLFYNGLVYFFVATAFNLVNLVLELVRSIHSKSLLPLYAPLMCVLCQRMLLVELDAVWSSQDADIGMPGLQLVDHVVGPDERRSRASETNRLTELIDTLEARNTGRASVARFNSGDIEQRGEKSPTSQSPRGSAANAHLHLERRTVPLRVQTSTLPSADTTPPGDDSLSPSSVSKPPAAWDVPPPTREFKGVDATVQEYEAPRPAQLSPKDVQIMSPAEQQRALAMAGM